MTTETNPNLETAVKTFIARQNRTEHPKGKFDNAGRWYPASEEHCSCCNSVRTPSRAWPNSYNTHCRTAEHIANLFGVDSKELKRAVKIARAAIAA